MFSREEVRASRPTKEMKMIFDVLMTFPYFAVHVPSKNILITPKGTVEIPENYQNYPILAIFYVKYLMKKNPYDLLPSTVNWPEPYVVVNTITKRFQDHKLFANKNADVYVERLQNAIASGIKIPESKKNERLGQPKKTKTVTKEIEETFIDATNARKELDEYFRKLQDGTLTGDLEGGLCKVKTLISCKALFGGHTQELQFMATNVRKVWIGEIVCGMVSNKNAIDDNDLEEEERNASGEQTTTAREESEALDTTSNGLDALNTQINAIETEESFWEAIRALHNELRTSPTQLEECRKAAVFLLGHKKILQTFTKQKDTARALFYINLKECLGTSWEFRIYRGIRCKKNGQLKVSFKIKNCPHISSYWVNIELTSKDNILDDILLDLACDVREKESDKEAGSETEVSQ